MYARNIEGRTLTFGVSGALLYNVLVMYDRETDSLWSHLTGSAIKGSLAGASLEVIPALHTSWDAWRAEHPDTLVLSKRRSPFGSYASDPYEGYYISGRTGIGLPLQTKPEALGAKEVVLGLLMGTETKAYPYAALRQKLLVNDVVASVPVLVVFNEADETAIAFDRRVGERTLSFEFEDRLLLRDRETGSLWHGLSGIAEQGPLQGTKLEPLPATRSFWFGWVNYFPRTGLFDME